MKISHQGTILVAVPLVCELFFVSVLTGLQWQAEAEMRRAVESKNIIEQADKLMISVLSAGTATSAYGMSIRDESAGEDAYKQYQEACQAARAQLNTLFKLVEGRPKQLKLLNSTSKEIEHYDKIGKIIKDVFDEKKIEDKRQLNLVAWAAIKKMNDDLQEINTNMDRFLAGERRVQEQSPAAQARNRLLIEYALFAGVAANVLLAIGMAAFFSSNITARLLVIVGKTRQLAKGEELAPALSGNDEIASLDQAFHETANKLHELDQLKKEFVSMISHDLRTPLTSIGGLLEFLDAGMLGELNERGKLQVAYSQSDVTRLIGLINELLDIDKMESDKLDMRFEPVGIQSVIDRSVAAISGIASSRNISIETPQTNELVIADADRLVQVLVNLMSNALKFSPLGSTIEITVETANHSLTLRITDHGCGIPAAHVGLVFDRFHQVKFADSKKGTGLGLAICKAIIEQHGGKIGVESDEGKGSTFWFSLPREKAEEGAEVDGSEEISAKSVMIVLNFNAT